VVFVVHVPERWIVLGDQELMVEVLLHPPFEGLQAAKIYDPVSDVQLVRTESGFDG
jgi:hypothetical protein